MSLLGVNYAVRHEAAPTREALERRLREVAAMGYLSREVEAELYAFDMVFGSWLYFAPALAQAGGDEPVSPYAPSESPLVWAVRARHHVTTDVWLNTPDDVVEVDKRLEAVTEDEFTKMFQANRRTLIAEYKASGVRPEAIPSLVGPAHLGYEAVDWGKLRAFYARAAAEGRYVVSEIGP